MNTFVTALGELSMGELAVLRQLSQGTNPVLPWGLEGEILDGEERWPYLVVATLYAVNPSWGGEPRSFAVTMRELQQKRPGHSIERRFVALLNSDEQTMPRNLGHAVRLARLYKVRVDWRRLLNDLRRWDEPDRSVKLQWARDFWTGE